MKRIGDVGKSRINWIARSRASSGFSCSSKFEIFCKNFGLDLLCYLFGQNSECFPHLWIIRVLCNNLSKILFALIVFLTLVQISPLKVLHRGQAASTISSAALGLVFVLFIDGANVNPAYLATKHK